MGTRALSIPMLKVVSQLANHSYKLILCFLLIRNSKAVKDVVKAKKLIYIIYTFIFRTGITVPKVAFCVQLVLN